MNNTDAAGAQEAVHAPQQVQVQQQAQAQAQAQAQEQSPCVLEVLLQMPSHVTARVFAFAGFAPYSHNVRPEVKAALQEVLNHPHLAAHWLIARFGLQRALHTATRQGRADWVRALMAPGVGGDRILNSLEGFEDGEGDPSAHTYQGKKHEPGQQRAPLVQAARMGRGQVMAALLPSARPADVCAALTTCIRRRHTGAVVVLLPAFGAALAAGGSTGGTGSTATGSTHEMRVAVSTALTLAAEMGMVTTVQQLLDVGMVTADSNEAELAMVAAARHHQLPVVQLLLDAGVDVTRAGADALRVAAQAGDLAIVELLLAAGTPQAFFGRALVAAATCGHLDVVSRLLSTPRATAMLSEEGGQALEGASGRGHLPVVEALLAAASGAQLRAWAEALVVAEDEDESEAGAAPPMLAYGSVLRRSIMGAVHCGREEILEKLLAVAAAQGFNTTVGGHPALLDAAYNEQPGLLKQLLATWGNASQAARDDALVAAMDCRLVSLGKICIEELGAWVDADDGQPLFVAVHMGCAPAVDMLLAAGANPKNCRVLLEAASEGHASILTALLAAGADAATIDASGALVHAAKRGDVAMVQQLLDAGADVHVRGNESMERAFEGGYSEVVELLLEAGAKALSPLVQAAYDKEDGAAAVRQLVAEGHDPNEQEGHALLAAATQGRLEVVQALVECGADVRAHGARAVAAVLDRVTSLMWNEPEPHAQHSDIVVLLLKGAAGGAGGVAGDVLSWGIRKDQMDLVAAALDAGAHVGSAAPDDVQFASNSGYAVCRLLDIWEAGEWPTQAQEERDKVEKQAVVAAVMKEHGFPVWYT